MIDIELALPESMLFFENLEELLSTLDEYIENHRRAIQNYSEKLGSLLRSEKTAGDGRGKQKKPGSDEKDLWILFKLDEAQERGKQEKNSTTFLRVANVATYSAAAAEASVLFRIVETLKQRINTLENARKIVSELPLRGNKSDQIYAVSFASGLPRQVIPLGQGDAKEFKFAYNDQFQLKTIDETTR